ncbi:flagellar biosynthesis anti-sigma factor FlgM [Scandinavium goeteborgense]|jgi:flagellar biosynthesis anti-sigma factor FlgM|nr:flagellar biosynthesis anti-sigma factor FlgM [Scandinavium goeteborgense]
MVNRLEVKMKIAPMSVENMAAATQSGSGTKSKKNNDVATVAPQQSADELTQSSLHSAQVALNNDPQDDVDMDSVTQMQAALANGSFTVDNDELAASMLSFFN